MSSKKPSNTQPLREAFNTLYFDEDVGGPKLKGYLEIAGIKKVVLWSELVKRSTPDPDWISEVGKHGMGNIHRRQGHRNRSSQPCGCGGCEGQNLPPGRP